MEALAAHQIAIQCVTLAYAIPCGLSMATSLQVGFAASANHREKVKSAVFFGISVALIISTIISIIFIFYPENLIQYFLKSDQINNVNITRSAISFLFFAAIFQCFDSIQAIANGALRGLKDTLVPMLISIGCYWIIGICGGYYLSFHTDLGTNGIWYGLTLGISSIGIILLFRFLKKINGEMN